LTRSVIAAPAPEPPGQDGMNDAPAHVNKLSA